MIRVGVAKSFAKFIEKFAEAPQAPKFFEICHSPFHLPPRGTHSTHVPDKLGTVHMAPGLAPGHSKWEWGFFQYKKGSISIQDIIIYHHISCRYHDISLCIMSSIMIYHVPRRHMIYRDIIFFFSPCDIMSISCRVLDDTWT